MIDPRGHDTFYTVNALNQVVREQSREVATGSGIRYEKLTWYDANDNVVRTDIDNRDETGTPQSNTHFSTIYEYDILNHVVRVCQEKGIANLTNTQLTCADFPAGEAVTTEYQYDANRNRTQVKFPQVFAAVGQQLTNTVDTEYDERDLVFKTIRAKTDPAQSTTQIDYDPNRNRKAAREGLESSPRVTTSTYDGYDRLVTAA